VVSAPSYTGQAAGANFLDYFSLFLIEYKQKFENRKTEANTVMKTRSPYSQTVAPLMFRLLPVQILLALIGCINSIVSSLFASNVIGSVGMTVTGFYSPVSTLLGAISAMLVGGSQILCGKYMGKNLVEKMQNVFSLDLIVSCIVGGLFTAFFILTSVFDLNGFLAQDPETRPLFNQYVLGQAAGMLPTVLYSQFAAFLSLENQARRTTIASIIAIAANIGLNFLFVSGMGMGVTGLALASSLSAWLFLVVEAQYFISGKSTLRLSFRQMQWRESGEIIKIGFPGAMSTGYQAVRAVLVNAMLAAYVGSVGVSALATVNTLMSFFWAIPNGMLAVTRMMFSISIGEEDRQTLVDTMRTALYRYVPIMCAVVAMMIAAAVPLTRLYYRDVSDPVYALTVTGFRIVPLCMPLSLIYLVFSCFGQVSGKQALVYVLAALDGVVCVAGFTALLIPSMGMNSVYVANVLNGVVTTLVILFYSVFKRKKFPRSTEDLMVIPENFGVEEKDRLDLSLRSMEEVVQVSRTVQAFCLEKGIDARRAYLAGLSMEEMAGNVIAHGFTKDKKRHFVDIRVVYRDNGLILRIRDTCKAFDPATRKEIAEPDDPYRNMGIRMVYSIAGSINYQSVLGLNVLTITF
jgi:Na+-driven multidrug efflux pump/anti-sigma regulatory factor (Ser/Thr protein kinase)